MFKWPSTPAGDSDVHEIADYIEMTCWQQEEVSDTGIAGSLERIGENDHRSGVSEESEVEEVVGAAFREIERREKACRGGYPFTLEREGHSLRMDSTNSQNTIYLYLLLATRLNMKSQRRHADLDGTLLFEKLSAGVAGEYLGERSESYVFGSSNTMPFEKKIEELCCRMNEGGTYRPQNGSTQKRDAGVDVVAWKHFADRSSGKLVGVGQCKTGTWYADDISAPRAKTFFDKWTTDPPLLEPLAMFFVAEAVSRDEWRNVVLDAGLLFERCRIVDYRGREDETLVGKIVSWTKAAAGAFGLPTKCIGS